MILSTELVELFSILAAFNATSVKLVTKQLPSLQQQQQQQLLLLQLQQAPTWQHKHNNINSGFPRSKDHH